MFCCCEDSWAASICEARALGTVTNNMLDMSIPVTVRVLQRRSPGGTSPDKSKRIGQSRTLYDKYKKYNKVSLIFYLNVYFSFKVKCKWGVGIYGVEVIDVLCIGYSALMLC